MAAFEQNQQDSFNFNSELAQAKQFYADTNKAASAMNAADMAAEEELAEQKLKNLIEQQKLRVKQLEQMLTLEEEGLEALSSYRLTLSKKQFEARKKEIQKEYQLEEAALTKQIENENKKRSNQKKFNKKTSAVNTNEKASSSTAEIKASSKPKTNKTNSKSSSDTASSKTATGGAKQGVGQAPAAKGRDYSDESAGLEKFNLGVTSLTDIVDGLAENSKYLKSLKKQEKQNGESSTLDTLNTIVRKANQDQKRAEKAAAEGKKAPKAQVSQKSLDLSGTIIKNIEAAWAAEEELEEFKKDIALNTQLIILAKEQELQKELFNSELSLIKDRAAVEATIAFNEAHSEEFMAQALQKKQLGYLQEYQKLQLEAGKYAIDQAEYEKDQARKDNKAAKKDAASGIIDGIKKFGTGEFSLADIKQSYGKYMGQRTAELKDSGMNEASAELTAKFELLAEVSGNLAQTLNAQTDKIGARQAPIDTRLQGSTANDKILGSYWKQLARDMNKIGAVNPYFKQEDFASNIEALVNKGISYDVKQRAFLMTIQEKIANTFDAADGTLLRLVRIQQQDTTAGRLGMESALNSFLNSMYETSEYLTDVASSVRGSLEEMQALMEGAAGTELEFQVQKWMGSLYSVGMSQEAVQSIAQTFGQIASGDISGLTGSGTGNLLIMAANEAGMSIADILQDGLNADETNKLMQAMVNYLAEIAETSSDSRVVQQQLASVYGVKASDLKAATNLASSIKDVSKQDLTYSGMLGQLKTMANSMALRTSVGEMSSNVWDNFQYTMATQMANDPMLYLLPRVATLLEDYAGGIDLPFVNAMGFGVDLNTSVAQLMNVASMSGTILGSLGPMISGLAGAVSGSAMLSLAGIDTKGKAPVIARGSAQPLQNLSGLSISESGYIGNSSGSDIKNATLQDAEDSKKQQLIKAKDEEAAVDVATKANQAVVSIYNLLEEVAHGSQSLRVKVINNNAGGGGAVSSDQDVPSTNNSMNADNGNWVLSF